MPRKPITGVAACCARAASGQPAKLLPRNAMNSRRLMGIPQGKDHELNYSTVHRSKKRPLMSEMGHNPKNSE
jgi:hypothetical protein